MKRKAYELFSGQELSTMNLDPNAEVDITYVDPMQFLTADRFDLICKLIYIDNKVNSRNLAFAKNLYVEHLAAFGSGSFPDNVRKSMEDSIEEFDGLIETLAKEGISAEKAIPVGKDGNIVSGSLRTAIAIYFHLQLPIVKVPVEKTCYDYRVFQSLPLDESYLDYMALQYLHWSKSCHIALLYPIANSKEKNAVAEQYLKDAASICYKKEIHLTYAGLRLLLIHAYKNMNFAGTEDNNYAGISANAPTYYAKESSLTVFLLSETTLDQVVSAKTKVREYYQIGDHVMHTTDTPDEAITLGQMLFNQNSVFFLNYGKPFKYSSFKKLFLSFRTALGQANCDSENYLIESGSVLALFGLRKANDIDYLTSGEDLLPHSDVYENHDQYDNRPVSVEQLINDPGCHLYFMGVKFATLEQTIIFRKYRYSLSNQQDLKDYRDILLIQQKMPQFRASMSISECFNLFFDKIRLDLRMLCTKMMNKIVAFLHNFPKLYLFLRKLYRFIRAKINR